MKGLVLGALLLQSLNAQTTSSADPFDDTLFTPIATEAAIVSPSPVDLVDSPLDLLDNLLLSSTGALNVVFPSVAAMSRVNASTTARIRASSLARFNNTVSATRNPLNAFDTPIPAFVPTSRVGASSTAVAALNPLNDFATPIPAPTSSSGPFLDDTFAPAVSSTRSSSALGGARFGSRPSSSWAPPPGVNDVVLSTLASSTTRTPIAGLAVRPSSSALLAGFNPLNPISPSAGRISSSTLPAGVRFRPTSTPPAGDGPSPFATPIAAPVAGGSSLSSPFGGAAFGSRPNSTASGSPVSATRSKGPFEDPIPAPISPGGFTPPSTSVRSAFSPLAGTPSSIASVGGRPFGGLAAPAAGSLSSLSSSPLPTPSGSRLGPLAAPSAGSPSATPTQSAGSRFGVQPPQPGRPAPLRSSSAPASAGSSATPSAGGLSPFAAGNPQTPGSSPSGPSGIQGLSYPGSGPGSWSPSGGLPYDDSEDTSSYDGQDFDWDYQGVGEHHWDDDDDDDDDCPPWCRDSGYSRAFAGKKSTKKTAPLHARDDSAVDLEDAWGLNRASVPSSAGGFAGFKWPQKEGSTNNVGAATEKPTAKSVVKAPADDSAFAAKSGVSRGPNPPSAASWHHDGEDADGTDDDIPDWLKSPRTKSGGHSRGRCPRRCRKKVPRPTPRPSSSRSSTSNGGGYHASTRSSSSRSSMTSTNAAPSTMSTPTTLVTSTAPPPGYTPTSPSQTPAGYQDWTGDTLASVCPRACNPFDPAANKCSITTSCTTTGGSKYNCACRAGYRLNGYNPKDFSKQYRVPGQPYVYTAENLECDTLCDGPLCLEVLERAVCM